MLSDPDIVQLSQKLASKKRLTAAEEFQLAKLYHDRGGLDEAVRLLLIIEAEYENFPAVYVALGDVSLEGGLYEQAFEYYRTAYHTAPELLDRAAMLRFALCAHHTGSNRTAITLLETLIAVHPSFEPAYRLLLGIYDVMGDKKAVKQWQKKLNRVEANTKPGLYLGSYLRQD